MACGSASLFRTFWTPPLPKLAPSSPPLTPPRTPDARAVAFFCIDAVLTCIIVAKVAYTEIDWVAYMQEVEGVMAGVSGVRKSFL